MDMNGYLLTRRDFVGYGPNPPNPNWPDNARLALNLVINYEEGSEASFDDGDGISEIGLTEVSDKSLASRDLAADPMFELGNRVADGRVRRQLQAHRLPAPR